jgi:hypothetical protein
MSARFRFTFTAQAILACAALAAPAVAFAQEKPREPLPPGLEQAVDRGLSFLHTRQKADGSFDASGPPSAMTGLALLAFLSAGHTPDLGKYGLTVRNSVDFLLNHAADDGYFGNDGGRMYGHCIATIALAQVYGVEMDENQRRKVRAALDKALKLILAAQDVGKDGNSAGGWRYDRNSTDSDLSVTTWCILALCACRDAGLNVPKEHFQRALPYVLRCFRGQQGGFAYPAGGQVYASITAAGLFDLFMLDAGERDEAADAAKYLAEHPVGGDAAHFSCALYYSVLGGMKAGEDVWPGIWKNTHEQLLKMQQADGTWPPRPDEVAGEGKAAQFYPTAMSVITLAAPLRLLPVYAR